MIDNIVRLLIVNSILFTSSLMAILGIVSLNFLTKKARTNFLS